MCEFGVSLSTMSQTIIRSINFLYPRLSLLPLWPDWSDVEKPMPSAFKFPYPNTFAIIDSTELRCEVPSSLSMQSQYFSTFKSSTELRLLLPLHQFEASFCTPAFFSVSQSHRTLFEESGILDLLKTVPPGKGIMADRGFEIQDLRAGAELILNSAPTFKGSSKSLPED